MTTEITSFLPDILYLLTQGGYGVYQTNIFKGPKAPIPDEIPAGYRCIISVVKTGGNGEEGTHNDTPTRIAYEQPSAQIVVRHPDPDIAEAVAQELYAGTLNFINTFVNGTWWVKCRPVQEPFDLGLDPKDYSRWAFNLDSTKRVSPASS